MFVIPKRLSTDWDKLLKPGMMHSLIKMGFRMSESDNSLLVLHKFGVTIYILMYVDDIILTGSNESLLQEVISSLSKRFYCTISWALRPDITYLVNKPTQFNNSPSVVHWKAVKRILRYLKEISQNGIHISPYQSTDLYAYADADWAGDINDRRSISGYIVFLGIADLPDAKVFYVISFCLSGRLAMKTKIFEPGVELGVGVVAAGQIASAGMVAVSYVQRISEKVTGGSLEESKEALTIAETDARLFCTEFEDSGDPEKHLQDLLTLAKEGKEKGKVVAIGECGLDYDRLHFCPSDIQKKYFEKQFELAYTTKLPMFLHMRAAAQDSCDILNEMRIVVLNRFAAGCAYSFTGSSEDCDKLLSFSNVFVGVNGCSLKTVENLEVVKGIPVELMMIETDSPYCDIKNTHAGIRYVKSSWPSKKKDKHDQECLVKGRNEPCLVRQVLGVVAGTKGIADIDQLGKTLDHNTCRVFFPHDLDSSAEALLDSGKEAL
ncbi:hypothetical protein T459_15921 [Capsicum annuum]|uniref:Uncharacterized protein n=1 Tax=Capsicum annuum TaxID=4072 RepID=A0A2G2Z7B9_CAPAN|nr:hypothetical protein T459_15921 [Capsicum annuum]